MDAVRNGWFSEVQQDLWPGQCMSLQVESILHQEKSNYQDILLLQTNHHGKALVLDNIIQCTEFDEFAYQEMMSFLPLCAHPNPEKVLIIGGGDGGVAREVVKHPAVKQLVQVEIDDKVIAASKKYLPFMACGFNSPKLELIVGDGFAYMDKQRAQFDVIITDSSDPVGPAANLFTEGYFQLLAGALKPSGIICSQGGCVWTEVKTVRQTMDNSRKHFAKVEYALVSVPTYPCGQIGIVLGTNDLGIKLNEQRDSQENRKFEDNEKTLRYYHKEAHMGAFIVPKFVKDALYVAV